MNNYAQGDILLIPVTPPSSLVELTTDKIVVGYGETSGHSHVVEGVQVHWLVDACEDIASLEDFAQGNRSDNPDLFVSVPQGGELLHMSGGRVIEYDHKPVELPQGVYRVVRQRQATADSFRAVYD